MNLNLDKFLDYSKNPIKSYAKLKRKFDKAGNLMEESFFNTKGEMMNLNVGAISGYAKANYVYTNDNKVTQISYFSVKNKLIRTSKGYAKVTIKGDFVEYYDENEKPINVKR